MLDSKMQALCLACAIVFTIAHITLAQNTPQDYVNTHNTQRFSLNVSMSNVTWNNTVAAYAQNYANTRKSDCNLIHLGMAIWPVNPLACSYLPGPKLYPVGPTPHQVRSGTGLAMGQASHRTEFSACR
jgi:hypothetical protein